MVAAASLYSNAEDLATYARYHVSTTHNPLLDSVFAEVRNTDIQRPDGVQGIARTTDFIGLEKSPIRSAISAATQLYRL